MIKSDGVREEIDIQFTANDIAANIRQFIDKTGFYSEGSVSYDFYLICEKSNMGDPSQHSRQQDAINLQYLFCFIELLLKNKIDFKFVFTSVHDDEKYFDIGYDLYFSLRTAAAFYMVELNSKYKGLQIFDRLLTKINGREIRLFKDIAAAKEFPEIGRILPLIPITEKSYKQLIEINQRSGNYVKLYSAYYYAIIQQVYGSKLQSYIDKVSEECEDIIKKVEAVGADDVKYVKTLIKEKSNEMAQSMAVDRGLFYDKKDVDSLTILFDILIRSFINLQKHNDLFRNKAVLQSGIISEDIAKEMARNFKKAVPLKLLGINRFISERDISQRLFAGKRSAVAVKNAIINAINKQLGEFSELLTSKCNNIVKKHDKIYESLSKYYSNDTVIDSLIFISTLNFIVDNEKRFPNAVELDSLHETCVDYSQGIVQLVENAYKHAVSNNKGVANFTIRIRKIEDARNLYIQRKGKEECFLNVQYFMELYITDLQYKDFVGIKSKFIQNVIKQCADSGWEEFWKDRFGDSAIGSDWTRFKDGMLSREKIDEFTNDITLEGLITGNGTKLNEYLSMHQNVLFHYGLQIFHNVVRSADGYIQVVSMDNGSRKDGYFSIASDKYINPEINWENGTSYAIYLPIKKASPIDYSDTVATAAQDLGKKYEYRKIEIDWNKVREEVEKNHKNAIDDKPATVCKIVDHILYGNSKNKSGSELIKKEDGNDWQSDKIIYYIDCDGVRSEWYELLAKSLFMLLAQNQFIVKHIALINVENSHSAVKIFRQFALFYNREGGSETLKDKSVFIVDEQAEIDLLLTDKIENIVDNLKRYQIDGSMNQRAIEIIKHLGGGRRNG